MNVLFFPKHPLPTDAAAIGREMTVHVFPDSGNSWCCHEYDEGGASCLIHNVTKESAIKTALEFVRKFNAEMRVSNTPWGKSR